MSKKKSDDWRNAPALAWDSHSTDLPPLPDFETASESTQPKGQFIPTPLDPDVLAALHQAPEHVKRRALEQHLARRSRAPDGSELASALDDRIAQIRVALNEPASAAPSDAPQKRGLLPDGTNRGAECRSSPQTQVADRVPETASQKPKSRAGRKANTALNERIVTVLSEFGFDWRDKMEGVCEILDQRSVPIPSGSKKGWKTWLGALAMDPEWVRKALQHRSRPR